MASSRVVLPVLALEQGDRPFRKKVLKAAKNFTEQRIAPQSNSTSSITFSFQPPSQNTVVDRCVLLETDILLTAAAAAGPLTKDATSYRTQNPNARASAATTTVGFPCKR